MHTTKIGTPTKHAALGRRIHRNPVAALSREHRRHVDDARRERRAVPPAAGSRHGIGTARGVAPQRAQHVPAAPHGGQKVRVERRAHVVLGRAGEGPRAEDGAGGVDEQRGARRGDADVGPAPAALRRGRTNGRSPRARPRQNARLATSPTAYACVAPSSSSPSLLCSPSPAATAEEGRASTAARARAAWRLSTCTAKRGEALRASSWATARPMPPVPPVRRTGSGGGMGLFWEQGMVGGRAMMVSDLI
jgi:hypothetical protein